MLHSFQDILKVLNSYVNVNVKSLSRSVVSIASDEEKVHGVPWASLIAHLAKNLSAMQETWVQSLGWEDPLEKEMAAHSSILAWEISWTEEPGGLQSMGSQTQTRLCN